MTKFIDIFTDKTKEGCKIPKEDYLPNGIYPIIDQGKGMIAGYTNQKEGLFVDVPAIIFGDHTRIIKYIDFPFFLGADGVKLLKRKANIEADDKYLYYYMKSKHIPNTGYNRHFKWLKETDYKLISLDEQKHIVNVLSLLEHLIALKNKQLLKLDELVKSRFIEMFGDPVTNPYNFETGTIRDVVSEVKYGTSAPANEAGKYPYLRMGNITYDGHLDLNNLKYIDVPDDELHKYVVKKGDVLFNRTNSKELVGKTCVFNLEKPMIIAGYIIRVRTNERVLPEYLSAVLNSYYGKQTLMDMCKSIVGQANINAQELQDIKLIIPSIRRQEEYRDFEKQINDKSKFEIQHSLNKLETLKKSLMQEYFA